MGADVEWGTSVSDPRGRDAAGNAAAPETDELLDVGRSRRRPLWLERLARHVPHLSLGLRYAVASVAAVGVVIAYFVSRPTPQRPAPVIPDVTTVDGGLPTDASMSMIVAKARQSGPLVDYVRSDARRGACTLVPIGHSPQHAIVAAVRKALPGYTVRDIGRTLDEFTAMCAIDLRARDAHGSILIVEVVAPQHRAANTFTAISVANRSSGTTTVSMAAALTEAGWSVTVGAIGPGTDQPPSEALVGLAQDPALLW